MIPRFKPKIGWLEFWAIFWPTKAGAVADFEAEFAREMGQKFALAFPHGRTGLLLLLESLGVRQKEVICPTYTCVVVAHAISISGNTPVFVDAAADFNMDFDLVDEAISSETGAIVATSIFGNPVDLDRLDVIRRKHPGIHIIQDCAHSFAAEWHGRPVNVAGTAAFFGMNVSKIITSVFGGMVTTDSEDVYRDLRALRDRALVQVGLWKSIKRRCYLFSIFLAFSPTIYWLVNVLERNGFLNRFVKYFDESKIDMPADYRDQMSAFEATIGRIQVKKYRTIVAGRRLIADRYCKLFGIEPVKGGTYSHFPVLVNDREVTLQTARSEGVQLGTIIDYSCAQMKAYANCRYFRRHDNANRFKDQVVNLPMLDSAVRAIKQLVDVIVKV